MVMVHKKWGVLPSLLALIPLFACSSWWAIHEHYALPVPVGPVPSDDLRISESHILGVAQHLSETIGYRTVGTKEHAVGDAWMMEQITLLQNECSRMARDVHIGRHLECEVWRQQGSGNHRFDIMGHRLYKTYVDLTNIILRISDGSAASKEHAILVNSHIDSTPPSPGAADDALPVGVMLECIRILIHTQDWEPRNAIVFLFNNAEESLQDGSHLYSTQHPTANTVRAVINLEAAGTTGPELLFQATSEEMIEAYTKVPRPYGTVLANDVFSSGIILSDTDFRQFEQYLNVTGVDMAIVGHSYFYHTQKDLVKYIEPGVAQHMAENTLALLHHFTAPNSPLPSMQHSKPHKPHIVYFSVLGKWFFTYSFSDASAAYTMILGASLALVWETAHVAHNAGFVTMHLRGVRNFLGGLLGALLGANAVAYTMTSVVGRALTWFSREWLSLVLYGPPAFAGVLISQLFFFHPAHRDEYTTLTSVLLLYATLSTILQVIFEIGSASLFAITAVPLFFALALNAGHGGRFDEVRLRTYAIAGIVPVVVGTEVWCGTADVFVPLTGRMGEKAPAEFIIASMTALIGLYTFPFAVPLAHRFGRKATMMAVLFLTAFTTVTMAKMAMRNPYDAMHPKRLYVIHSENITTGEVSLNFAGADSAAGLDHLVHGLANSFGQAELGPEYELGSIVMNDWNGDWDSLYPFSAFLTPYKIRLPTSEADSSPWHGTDKFKVMAVNDVIDREAGIRNLTLQINHPGVIWTVIAFDAHVLHWNLDENPPPHFARHHVKEASFYGVDTWSIDLAIRIPTDSTHSGLKVNFVGTKEAVQWPAKSRLKEAERSEELQMLASMHDWLEEKTSGAVDALLFGSVGGVTVV